MMYKFDVPGKSLREYKGIGTLITPCGTQYEGGFECAQLADGRIFGKFYFKDLVQNLPMLDPEGRFLHYTLKGVTIQGWDVWSDTLYIVKRTYADRGAEIVFHAVNMEITLFELSSEDNNSSIYLARFGLVNLKFDGDRIDLDVNGYKISVNRVDGYEKIIESLKTYGGIEVTCEAFVKLKSDEVTEHLLSTIQDVCVLLSLASGTRVNWVYYDVLIAPNLPARSYLFGDAITLPFSTCRLILSLSNKLAQFVNQTFDAYKAKKDGYKLYSVIAMYLTAKIPHLFVGSRILLISQALEALKSLITPDYMLDEIKLDEKLEALVEGTRQIWLESFPELNESGKKGVLNAITGRNKVKGLARFSYAHRLKNIVISLELPKEHEKELQKRIERLVKVRDVLTHNASAYEKAGAEAHHDFARFVNLTDIILLKVLEYKGEYLDCSDDYAAKILE
ncbi:MAG: hypothetical protein FJ014_14635 [Chloroflexi bacterium]|nr:hypothetical protein [Chloroflexota bacterium]